MLGIGSGALGWVLVGLGIVVVLAWIVVTVRAVRRIAHRPAASAEALALHDRAVGWLGRSVATVVFVTVAIVSSAWSSSARMGLPGLALGLCGAVTVLALIGMERRWPVPGGTVRSADLRRRRVRDVLPRAGVAIAGLGLLVGFGTIVITGLTRRPPAVEPPLVPGPTMAWPSWLWSAPLSIGLVVLVALVALGIALLLRRPALAGFERDTDLAYRRAGVDRLLRVLSASGFVGAALVLGQVHSAIGGTASLIDVLAWSPWALLVAGLGSVELLRTHLPGARRPTHAATAASATP